VDVRALPQILNYFALTLILFLPDLERIEREVSEGLLDFYNQRDFSRDVSKLMPLEIQQLIPEFRQILLGTRKRLHKVT
jgi:hypothetical protein